MNGKQNTTSAWVGSIYPINGYKTRAEYLEFLVNEYGDDHGQVHALAAALGEEGDFGVLETHLDRYFDQLLEDKGVERK